MINPIYKIDNRINKIFTEIHIADLHFGAIEPQKQYMILEEQFLSRIETIQFDIVSINGDLFDHKFMANSDSIMYATLLVKRLVDICRVKGATLIIINGTPLHDSMQLKLFYQYMSDRTVDVRIIETVRFEYIKGKKVLCIPEIYGKPKEYYENFLYNSGMYDAVYMHGTLRGAIFGKNEADLGSIREPVFDMQHFNLCKGPIISGHLHIPGCYNSHFYYCGSPYTWKFGEEVDKGFIVLLHNTESREYYVHFEPIQAFRYETFNLDDMIKGDPKNIIEYVQNLKNQGIDHIRIQFTIDNEETLNIVKNYYKTDPSIKIETEDKAVQIMKASEEMADKYKEYEYIFDKGLSPYEITARYINQNKGYSYITAEELIQILNDPL